MAFLERFGFTKPRASPPSGELAKTGITRENMRKLFATHGFAPFSKEQLWESISSASTPVSDTERHFLAVFGEMQQHHYIRPIGATKKGVENFAINANKEALREWQEPSAQATEQRH